MAKKTRMTKQRKAILRILKSTDSHPTADWIYEKVRNEIPNISLGTVYRNLNKFVENNLVSKIEIKMDKKESYFELLQGNHHHHLICLKCGKIIPLKCPLKNYENKISQQTNYQIVEHRLKLYGLCPDCK